MRKLSVCITGHPDVTCHASVGETVVLPCTSTFPEELNISHSKLYWQKGDDLVHFFHKGHDDLESQDEQYHGRTSLFLNEVKHGNFSLKLSNVQLQDKAVYSCIYSQAGHQTKKSQIKLSVSGKNLFLGQREGAGGSISCWQATYKQLQQLVWLSSIFKANLHLVALYSLLFLGEKNVKGIE